MLLQMLYNLLISPCLLAGTTENGSRRSPKITLRVIKKLGKKLACLAIMDNQVYDCKEFGKGGAQ
jgi:hypothetical protein